MTVISSTSILPPKTEHAGELGLFPEYVQKDEFSKWKRNVTLFAATCLLCYVIFLSGLMLQQQKTEHESQKTCKPGYSLSPSDKCYKVFHSSRSPDRDCVKDNADFASILSIEENAFVHNLINKTLGNAQNVGCYIGFFEGIGTPWFWWDRSENDYTNWDVGMPKDSTTNYEQAFMDPKNGKWKMNPGVFHTEWPVLCEQKDETSIMRKLMIT